MKTKTLRTTLLTCVFSTLILSGSTTALAMKNELTGKNIFDITTQIYIDGKLVTSPKIITFANEKAVIASKNSNNSQSFKMGLIAKEDDKNSIEMNFDIQYAKDNTQVHSHPHIFVKPNQEATLQFAMASGHIFEMHVLAKRK